MPTHHRKLLFIQIFGHIADLVRIAVKVTEQDRLPKIMCGECVYKLDLLSEFRENVVKTEHLLESLVDGVKPEVINHLKHNCNYLSPYFLSQNLDFSKLNFSG